MSSFHPIFKYRRPSAPVSRFGEGNEPLYTEDYSKPPSTIE